VPIRGDPSEVGVEHVTTVGLDAPRTVAGGDRIERRVLPAAAELEDAFARHGNVRQIRVRDELCRHLADVGRAQRPVDAELEEPPDAGVVGASR
jgi:hypothetical protein